MNVFDAFTSVVGEKHQQRRLDRLACDDVWSGRSTKEETVKS